MKKEIVILALMLMTKSERTIAQKNMKHHELFMSSGASFGHNSDFVNTNDINFYVKKSVMFQVGYRNFINKYLFHELGFGISSLNPNFYFSKKVFNDPNSTDIKSFLPSIYEFPFFNYNINFYKELFKIKSNTINVIGGIGVKFYPRTSYLDWATLEVNGIDFAELQILFERHYNFSNNNTELTNRNLGINYYLAINCNIAKVKKQFFKAEVFINPTINDIVKSAYFISLPNSQYRGNAAYKFSSFGVKIIYDFRK